MWSMIQTFYSYFICYYIFLLFYEERNGTNDAENILSISMFPITIAIVIEFKMHLIIQMVVMPENSGEVLECFIFSRFICLSHI